MDSHEESDNSELLSDGSEFEYGFSDEDDSYCDNPIEETSDDVALPLHRQELNYRVLKPQDIQRRQDDAIAQVSTILSVAKPEAVILLCMYNWSVNLVSEEWFGNEQEVRKSSGLLNNPCNVMISTKKKKKKKKNLTCTICYETYHVKEFTCERCGHRFCNNCWSQYVSISIGDGPGCLMLRCPEPSCRVVVGQDMINSVVSDEYRKRFSDYLMRSYVEQSVTIKWCPAPGCEFAVELDSGSERLDVVCDCSYGFCWNCTEESHRPVDCKTVSNWMVKANSEDETKNWIAVNSKSCPKCKKAIEKNEGCMHMTCRAPCNYEFCWLCLESWKLHGPSSGGMYACNRYEEAKKKENYAKAEEERECLKQALERYVHYYERWASNNSSREKALASLSRIQSETMKKLSDIYRIPETQLEYITEAWLQIVECRRVLKWTYTYGYYLPVEEKRKKNFFEYLQGEAEARLESLHFLAEKELETFLDESQEKGFQEFSVRLIDLTKVTKNQFQNLCNAVEDGLVA